MSRGSKALAVVVVLVLVVLGVLQSGVWVQAVSTGGYETTDVTAVDANGTELATVDARIADSNAKRIVGLSRTDSLAPDEGMLFVFDEEREHGFVMRGMAFPLDIVFADANGTVTAIRHAAAPDGVTLAAQLEEYSGRGKYVLEVNRGWANRTGLDAGDRLRIPNETAGGESVNAAGGSAGANASDGSTTNGSGDSTPNDADDSATNDSDDSTANATATPRRPEVTGVDANGTELGSVRVMVADNGSERFTGLSDTESLGPDEGMLFVYEQTGEHTYVMRDMDFPLDIVYVAGNGTVTAIHHAPVPPEGTEGTELEGYSGRGQYVLEVNRGWTNETGLDVGDRVRVPATV